MRNVHQQSRLDKGIEPTEDDIVLAESLLEQGYRPTSNKFRLASRLPEGKTGIQALEEVAPELVQGWREAMEQDATDQFLRVYSREKLSLTIPVFVALKAVHKSPDTDAEWNRRHPPITKQELRAMATQSATDFAAAQPNYEDLYESSSPPVEPRDDYDHAVFWMTKDGRILRIVDMADSHLVNCVAFLQRYFCKMLAVANILQTIEDSETRVATGEPIPDRPKKTWREVDNKHMPTHTAMVAEARRRGLSQVEETVADDMQGLVRQWEHTLVRKVLGRRARRP